MCCRQPTLLVIKTIGKWQAAGGGSGGADHECDSGVPHQPHPLCNAMVKTEEGRESRCQT